MTRLKKKLNYEELEGYIIEWAVGRIEEQQGTVDLIFGDKSLPDDEKDFLFSSIADELAALMELMVPLHHEEEDLVEWAKSFVTAYQKDIN